MTMLQFMQRIPEAPTGREVTLTMVDDHDRCLYIGAADNLPWRLIKDMTIKQAARAVPADEKLLCFVVRVRKERKGRGQF